MPRLCLRRTFISRRRRLAGRDRPASQGGFPEDAAGSPAARHRLRLPRPSILLYPAYPALVYPAWCTLPCPTTTLPVYPGWVYLGWCTVVYTARVVPGVVLSPGPLQDPVLLAG